MNEIWTNCEQNNFYIIFSNLYRGSIYRTAIYNVNLDYRKCQVFLLDKISYNQTCKNAENTSYSYIFPNIPLAPSMGDILHYKTFVRLWNQGHVFHSHVTLKISPPSNHKLYQIPAQFTPNPQIDFDTHFDKTLIFPSKTKLSDNLKI